MELVAELPPAAWYVDPDSPEMLRYWDGQQWTEHTAPIETVADVHTGHFEAVRTEGRRSLGLSDGARRISALKAAKAAAEVNGARSLLEPPELGAGWFIAEGLSIKDEAIITEHVIVGAAGVYLLISKDHSDSDVWVAERSFLVDGHNTDYLRDAHNASQAVSRMLKSESGLTVAVEPVIAVKAKALTIKAQPLDTHVVAASLLGKWFMRLEPMLTPKAIRAISDAIGAHESMSAESTPSGGSPTDGEPSASDDAEVAASGNSTDKLDDASPQVRSFAPEAKQSLQNKRRSLFN